MRCARLQRMLAALALFGTTPLASFLGSLPLLSQEGRYFVFSRNRREPTEDCPSWDRRGSEPRNEASGVVPDSASVASIL